MHELIAWCGFLGGWLLVAGPLDQAMRELAEEEFERDTLAAAAEKVEPPAPISRWWLLLPPAYSILKKRRDDAYRQQVGAAMDPADLQSLLHMRDVAGAWAYVAAGAGLIATKETWELRETYEWPEWVFWAVIAFMVSAILLRTAGRVRQRHHFRNL